MRMLLVVMLVVFSGCSSTREIYQKYDTLDLKHGVDEQSAKILAQRVLLGTLEKGNYRVSRPDIKTGPMVYKYPDYWFVVFGHNLMEPFSQNAATQSFKELLDTDFLVVIDKKTGRMPFYGEWYPKRENDFDWVFHPQSYNPHAYSRKDPLALPPGRQTQEVY